MGRSVSNGSSYNPAVTSRGKSHRDTFEWWAKFPIILFSSFFKSVLSRKATIFCDFSRSRRSETFFFPGPTRKVAGNLGFFRRVDVK
jgi:hypothetical protein